MAFEHVSIAQDFQEPDPPDPARAEPPRRRPAHPPDPGDARRLEHATNSLLTSSPELSAGAGLWPWQRLAIVALLAVLVPSALLGRGLVAIASLLAVPFVFLLALRIYAAVLLRSRAREDRAAATAGEAAPPITETSLPPYTVIVPLFRETEVAAQLVDALGGLDYPASRLDIVFVVETIDPATPAALRAAGLRPGMRILAVPDGAPRTKPRALNYALACSEGEFVAVYDAEDMPEPDQLRRALAAFAAAPGEIGCVQARLNIYNPRTSWLTHQFTIEYTALFDALLPALARLDLPVPLGGTSNHFPRHVLQELGGWDPYNVTEDADLGLRLMRRGWSIGLIASTTWEQAPESWSAWRSQRTRWLKGWMQTVLVHTREPARLVRELGPWKTAGFLMLLGGLCASALLHPWFLALMLYQCWTGEILAAWQAPLGALVIGLSAANLALGYGAAMSLGAAAVRARGFAGLARHVLAMPIYWLAISFAAHRALWQLARDPHSWEKTPHSARPAQS